MREDEDEDEDEDADEDEEEEGATTGARGHEPGGGKPMTFAMLPCESDVEQMNASELRALLDQHGSAPKDMAPKGRLLQLVRELLAHARKRAAEAEHAAAVLEGRSRYARHADEPQAHQVVDETVEPFRAWCNECLSECMLIASLIRSSMKPSSPSVRGVTNVEGCATPLWLMGGSPAACASRMSCAPCATGVSA